MNYIPSNRSTSPRCVRHCPSKLRAECCNSRHGTVPPPPPPPPHPQIAKCLQLLIPDAFLVLPRGGRANLIKFLLLIRGMEMGEEMGERKRRMGGGRKHTLPCRCVWTHQLFFGATAKPPALMNKLQCALINIWINE